MMNGILRIQTYRPRQSAPVEGVTVVITGSGFTAHRITHALAKELGYDAGFGAGTYADDVATFCSKELVRRLGK